jgi:uncharacterized metal-binding protein
LGGIVEILRGLRCTDLSPAFGGFCSELECVRVYKCSGAPTAAQMGPDTAVRMGEAHRPASTVVVIVLGVAVEMC